MRHSVKQILFIASSLILAPVYAQVAEDDSHPQWDLLDQYCTDCHNSVDWAGEVAFDLMQPESITDDPALFEKVVRKLRGRMMPPPGEKSMSEAEYNEFVSYLETNLDELGLENNNPGYVGMRRLNRTEYANVIRDLFDLQVDASDLLPKDDESAGFDNIASVLSETPTFVDQYVSAARVVAALAVGDPAVKPESRSYYSVSETNQSRHDANMPLGTRGGITVEHFFPADGTYEFRVDGLVTGDYTPGLEYRHKVVLLIDDQQVFEHEVGGDEDMREVDQRLAPALAELNAALQGIFVPVTAGPHRVSLTFVARSFVESDEILHDFIPGGGDSRIMEPRRFEIAGPVSTTSVGQTPSRERILVCQPESIAEELSCAEQILGNVARQAFRRPLLDDDLDIPLAFYRRGREQGDFEAGIRSGLLPILVSPKFLYRAELPPTGLTPGSVYPISDIELASRLSFFLWSSLPDDELIALAVAGSLREPEVLNSQLNRMLGDPKAKALISNFSTQWLELRELDSFNPDPLLFPGVDRELRDASGTEIQLFLESILLENRNVLDLLKANHTFVNERLALHYGLDNVQGDRFREVTLNDPNRWGLLGKAGVLMITSYPNRTAPVLRGAWILEHITGTPPAAPPADVEALPETEDGEQALTVRERLEIHRRNPSCNSCHGVMDPLGFALENYDAVGHWRDKDIDAGELIDSTGEFANGTLVNNPRELSLTLTERPDLLVQTLTEKLMTYALGRRTEYSDMPTIRNIVRTAANDDYKFFSIVEGIVTSDAFQYQTIVETTAEDALNVRN